VLTEAGLSATVVDVESFALHNGFEINHPDAMTGMVGLLNIGHDVTTINVLDDGVPILTRDIAVGTRRLREDLMRERGLTGEESDAMLQGFDRSPHLDAVAETRGEEIAIGIERAIAFIQQSTRGAELRQIFTCGGGSRIPGFNALLGRRLRVTVQQANPLSNLNVRDGALESLVTDEIAPLLMLPIGLALRQVA
jgi:type IV pilus assembly protein PilM